MDQNQQLTADAALVEESLVEEVSIDGMRGLLTDGHACPGRCRRGDPVRRRPRLAPASPGGGAARNRSARWLYHFGTRLCPS